MDLSSELSADQKEKASDGSRGLPRSSNEGVTTPSLSSRLSPWAIALGLFLVTLFLSTRNTAFPYYYEKDAHSKVRQVVTGERNFLHPPLMLNAADLVIRVTGIERTEQNAAEAGRFCMAFFTAGAVTAFALLGYRLRGACGAICVGLLVASHQLVFELSHYFKEDPALLFGLALSFLGLQLYWEKRSIAAAAFLGIACALAVSGKYVGIAAILMAIALFIIARKSTRPLHWAALFGAFLLTIAIVDYQFVIHFDGFLNGFDEEMRDLTRHDKRDQIPQFTFVHRSLTRYTANAIWVLLAVGAVELLRHHRRHPIRWLLILYPVIFLNVLLWSPRLFSRHFLPVLAIGTAFAALALPYLAAILKRLIVKYTDQAQRLPEAALTLPLLAVVFFGWQYGKVGPLYDTFANPTREKLIPYINAHLPKDAVVAYDKRAFLLDCHDQPRKDLPLACQAVTVGRLSSFNSIQALYDLGVTHIVAHSVDSKFLFAKELQGDDDEAAPAEVVVKNPKKGSKGYSNVLFYQELLKSSKEELYVPNGNSSYISPGLKLYKLKPPETMTASATTPEQELPVVGESGH